MNQATEVYSREFDTIFFKLPPHIRERIENEDEQEGFRQEGTPWGAGPGLDP